jgi:predicted O-methyltransferase YrrM
MAQERWTQVDDYLAGALIPSDTVLDAAIRAGVDAGMPQIQVSPTQGRFLYLMARVLGARKILEIGTLAGYSTIWMARALPPGGRLITLEVDSKHAGVARSNFRRARLDSMIEVRIGVALESLPGLATQGAGPFDLVFIDADKENNPEYVAWALRMSHPGTVMIVDNVVRHGAVVDKTSQDASIRGIRGMLELVASEPRLEATAIQTVGVRGYDGFAMIRVTG